MSKVRQSTKKSQSFDIVVVGGGLAGLSLTALLASQNFTVACIDKADPKKALTEDFDGRTTAVSWASQKILKSANVWDKLEGNACPIKDIQILDGDSPVLLEFFSHEVDDRAFGWIIENRLIRAELYKAITKNKNAQFFAPESVKDFSINEKSAIVHLDNDQNLEAQLIVGADGSHSFTREWMDIPVRGWAYNQHAVVCIATHENSHGNIAVEHFRSEGPFAVLPMTDDMNGNHRSSVVWTQHGRADKSALSYSEDIFNTALNTRFPDFYGEVKLSSKRFSYPLGLKHAYEYIKPRMVLVAEAAHAMHPIAGQGLNMSFRDIACLSSLLIEAKTKKQDLGSSALLESYQQKRRVDNVGMMAATDSLNKLFSNSVPILGKFRKLGVRAVSKFPPAKQFFMKQAMGMTGGTTGLLPELIREKD